MLDCKWSRNFLFKLAISKRRGILATYNLRIIYVWMTNMHRKASIMNDIVRSNWKKVLAYTCSLFRWIMSPLTVSTTALSLAASPVEAASISASLDSFSAIRAYKEQLTIRIPNIQKDAKLEQLIHNRRDSWESVEPTIHWARNINLIHCHFLHHSSICVQLGTESLPAEMRLFQLLYFFQPMPQQFGLPDSLFADVKEKFI